MTASAMNVAVGASGWMPPLAHGGRFTWDEALMVLAPIALLAGLLALANKRANALQHSRITSDTAEADQNQTVEGAPAEAHELRAGEADALDSDAGLFTEADTGPHD